MTDPNAIPKALKPRRNPCHDCAASMYGEIVDHIAAMPPDERREEVRSWFCHVTPATRCAGGARAVAAAVRAGCAP
jgi:hypothetical protein